MAEIQNQAWVVMLKIKAGEYEKSCTKLIFAELEEEAKNIALLGECHSGLGEGAEWEENGLSDLYWEFHYSVSSIKPVAPEHLAVVREYL